ncbi:hypothetical protein FACS189426_13490 [Bacteroidia bacterium]|nr:hypothetical protein FACS189426_13490 [Bacteroidia bacterium]
MVKEHKNTEEEIIIYQADDNSPRIDVHLSCKTLWLSQQRIANLFQTSRTNVVEHIDHIYTEGELDKEATCRNFRQVRLEGNRQVERELPNTGIILKYELFQQVPQGQHFINRMLQLTDRKILIQPKSRRDDT